MNFIRNRNGEYAHKRKPMSKWQTRICIFFMALPFALTVGDAVLQAVKPTTLVYRAVGHAEAAEMPKAPVPMEVMLQKIADCESGIRNPDGSAVAGTARQRGKDGRPIMNVNSTGSLDVGWAQINLDCHYDEVARLGLDVMSSEEDNKAFARHLYKLNGTSDWNASRSCWDR